MNTSIEVSFRVYGNLNDFLRPDLRHRGFAHHVESRGSIKDVIESIGIPHPEIDLIVVGGESAPYVYRPQHGDRVAVYPRFRDLDVGSVSLVRPPPLDEARFVLDAHLGRLTAYLRLVGLDCLYDRTWGDDRLAAVSHAEKRILLSRDVALLKRSVVEYGYWVRQTDPRGQLAEIAARFTLAAAARPFSRCTRCNCLLEPVAKETVLDRLPPRTREHYREFHQCTGCGRVYWKGGHYKRLREVIRQVLG